MGTGEGDGCWASADFGLSDKTQASPYVTYSINEGQYKSVGDKNIQAGCQQGSWLEAVGKCKSVGGRLCTVEELGNGCADQTGCWYDQRLVWTSDVKEHKVAKATSNEHAKCTEGMSVASSFPDGSACATKLVVNEEIHGIQCCLTSDTDVDGFMFTQKVDRCLASADFGLSDKTQASPYVIYSKNEGQYKDKGTKNIQAGCQQGTWSQAEAKCKSVGGRLCTVEELGYGCADQTGCWYDQRLVWTSASNSDTCTCTTPGEGTVDKNELQCTNGETRHCAWDQECYATEAFTYGKWSDGCRIPPEEEILFERHSCGEQVKNLGEFQSAHDCA